MKPIFFKIPKTDKTSIRVQEDKGDHFYDKLHYHPEYQITLIERGEGIFFGGAAAISFQPGDILFIGHNIPHLIKSSKDYYSKNSPGILSTSLFFSRNSFGQRFFDLPELSRVNSLLMEASRVIKLDRNLNDDIENLVLDMKTIDNEELIITLLKVLNQFVLAEKTYLNSEVQKFDLKEAGFERLDKVLNYTFSNASENITIDEISRLANLSKSQFSRYFKDRTGKSYIDFLNEIRIENSCFKLITKTDTIQQICFEVGFQNLSNFNRQFQKIKNMTPSKYRKKNKIF